MSKRQFIAGFKWQNSEIISLLELYKSAEVLWNWNTHGYNDNSKREEAYRNIIHNLGIEGLSVAQLRSKIRYLRSSYRCEVKKIKHLASVDEIGNEYEPSLFWFHLADSFLPRDVKRKSNLEYEEGTLVTDNTVTFSQVKVEEFAQQRQKQKKKRKLTNTIQSVKNIHQLSKPSNVSDEFDLFGKHIAMQLRKMPLYKSADLRHQIKNFIRNGHFNNLQPTNSKYVPNNS